MQFLHNINTKKKDKDKVSHIGHIILSYFIQSSLFWVILSLFFYFYLYDPSYGTAAKLKITSSYTLFFYSIFVIIFTLIFSSLIGVVLSLPSIFLKGLLIFKLARRKRRGQKPVILIFITKYTPLFILYLINISFLLFNFSVSPELMGNFFSKKNYLVLTSKKLNHLIFSKKTEDFYEYGKIIGEKFSKNSEFIFLLPDNVLNNTQYFTKTKLLLKNIHKILITNAYKSDTISSLFNLYPSGYHKLYTPVPSDSPPRLKVDKAIYLGIDAENSYNFNWLFSEFAQVEEINFTWFDMFLNKFAFSQPQLLYFFKIGFASYFNPLWKWPYIHTSNSNLLKKYSNDLLTTKNISLNKFAFYLTGLDENKQNKFIMQYTIKNNSNLNYIAELKQEDLSLAQFIGGLLSSGISNINLLPYLPEEQPISLHSFYSYANRNRNIFINEMISLSPNPVNITKNSCYVKILDFEDKNCKSGLINKLNYKNEPIYFDKKYEFYIKDKTRETFVCYLNDSLTILITRNYEEFNPNNFSYGQNLSKLFKTYSEKSSYQKLDKIKSNLSSEKTQLLFKDEFFKRFKIYKIDANLSKLVLMPNNQEKEALFKNYGDTIIHEMFEHASQ